MKRIRYFLPLLLAAALLLGLSSCNDEKETDHPSPKGSGNTVSFSIDGGAAQTRAATEGSPVNTAALPREKSIAKIYAVAFKSGVFYKTFQAVPDGGGYKFDMLQSGSFDLYLVANPDATLTTALENGSSTTPAMLAALLATQSPGENDQATNFLMTSEKVSVTLAGSGQNVGKILLTRAAARFDLYNRIQDLKMTKVTFKKRSVSSHIATQPTMAQVAFTNNKTYEAAQGLKDHECLGAIYSYENGDTGTSSLLLEGTFNGKPITHEILLGVVIERNHLYSIVISSEGGGVVPGEAGKLKFDIIVSDWNEDTMLEWNGDRLMDKSVPNFTVSGNNITTIPAAVSGTPAQNPTEVIVGQHTATDITVSVTSHASAGSKLESVQPLPAGYTVVPGAVGNKEGKLTQEFKIQLPENTGAERALDFVLSNGFDATARRTFTIKQPAKKVRPKMAIEYVAEYNVGTTKGTFTTSHDNDKSGYYSWNETTSACPTGYHLPTIEEWHGIFASPHSFIHFDQFEVHNNFPEVITVKGVTKSYTADYRGKGQTGYALKFKGHGNTMLAAYRFDFVGNFVANDLNSHLKVTVRYLGDTFTGSINNIETENFWKSNNEDDITRIFPYSGYTDSDTQALFGDNMAYWSSSEYQEDSNYRWIVEHHRYTFKITANNSKKNGYSVRPFSDN